MNAQPAPRFTGFRDRRDAGARLAGAVGEVKAVRDPPTAGVVVVGLARGGIEVAEPIATVLEAPLDVLAVRKIGHPWHPEYAIGAVAPGATPYVRAHDGLTDQEVRDAAADARRRAEQLDRVLHADHPALPVRGTTCVLADDGLATGATMIAAARWARGAGAAHVVVAVPVGARETLATMRDEADTVVCLEAPWPFQAVGLWYWDFAQVDDEDVVAALARGRRVPAP